MGSRYLVRSNRESGEGRYDIQLLPKVHSFPSILIELKSAGKDNRVDLKQLTRTALAQIGEKHYDTEMVSWKIGTICRYGVAFRGKEVGIAMEESN